MGIRKLVRSVPIIWCALTPNTLSSLTTKLPFEEDEFDHVRIHSIARGVPENKVVYILHSKNASSSLVASVGRII